MKFKMYAVKDVVVGAYGSISLFNNEASAIRWFDNSCEESKIAGDLQLWCLGEFDSETGIVIGKLDYVKGGVVVE